MAPTAAGSPTLNIKFAHVLAEAISSPTTISVATFS